MNTQNKNNFFKVPSLDKDGYLSQEKAMEIYLHHLTTPKQNHEKKEVRPVRSSIFKAMKATSEKYNHDVSKIIQEYIEKGKRVYFWSDQHFFHNNIIKFSGRPYESIPHMNMSMVENYFNLITDEDLVIFGGDVAFGEIDEVKELLAYLPGKKVLVLGNHDFGKKEEYRQYHIFEAVTMCFVFYKEIDGKICNLIVTHYPIENKYLPPNTLNIHGHTHVYLMDNKNINMAVEHTNYTPKDMNEEIETRFKQFCL